MNTIVFVLLLVALAVQLTTAKWCTKMGQRSYNEDDGVVKYITKIEKFCCAGYSLNGTECKPICNQNCPFGVCEEPGKCVCNQGYKLEPISSICEPYCTSPCGFGKCIEPDICKCDTGYGMSSSTKMCEPICTPQCTANSKCLRPNGCECNLGYQFNQVAKLCEPICEKGCTNGFCISPNVCECKKGYSFANASSTNTCEANRCTEPCPFGYCTINGECHCNHGYTKSLKIFGGKQHCEEKAIHDTKLLCIFLTVILIVSIIVMIIVKLLAKKGSYETKETEDAFKEKVAKK